MAYTCIQYNVHADIYSLFDILSGILSECVLTFFLAVFLASILSFYVQVHAHPRLAIYRVRVQAWPTASGARDMVRIHCCPQSR